MRLWEAERERRTVADLRSVFGEVVVEAVPVLVCHGRASLRSLEELFRCCSVAPVELLWRPTPAPAPPPPAWAPPVETRPDPEPDPRPREPNGVPPRLLVTDVDRATEAAEARPPPLAGAARASAAAGAAATAAVTVAA